MRFEENKNKKGQLGVGDIIIYDDTYGQDLRFIIYKNDWFYAIDMHTGESKNSEKTLEAMYNFYSSFKNFRIIKNKNIVITEENNI